MYIENINIANGPVDSLGYSKPSQESSSLVRLFEQRVNSPFSADQQPVIAKKIKHCPATPEKKPGADENLIPTDETDELEEPPVGDGLKSITWTNGDRYHGMFLNHRPSGFGVYTFLNGDKYEGTFKEGKRHGTGEYTWANGDTYVGAFVENERAGNGVLINAKGRTDISATDNKQLRSFAK